MQLKKLIENPSFLDYSLSNLKSPEDADERYSHTYSGSPIKQINTTIVWENW